MSPIKSEESVDMTATLLKPFLVKCTCFTLKVLGKLMYQMTFSIYLSFFYSKNMSKQKIHMKCQCLLSLKKQKQQQQQK